MAELVQHLDPCEIHNISAWVWASPSYSAANFSPRMCSPLWNLVINFHECTRWLYVESHSSLSHLLLFLASASSTCLSPFVYLRMLWLIFMPLHMHWSLILTSRLFWTLQIARVALHQNALHLILYSVRSQPLLPAISILHSANVVQFFFWFLFCAVSTGENGLDLSAKHAEDMDVQMLSAADDCMCPWQINRKRRESL